MSRERPINADVPPPAEPEELPEEPASEARPAPPGRKRPKPLAPKLLALLVVVAVGFIVAAVVGGTGGKDGGGESDESSPPAAIAPTGSGDDGEAAAPSFPALATNNTTRVGAADPAETAAAVALAVFPSRTDSQRPAAVTVVEADDWAGASAAAVLMAEPVRAPLLVGGPDGLPEPSAAALAALDPGGDGSTGGARAFAIGDVGELPGKTTTIAANGAAARAAAIAALRDRLVEGPPAHIVIAPQDEPALAVPAAAWAARSGDPVLFAAGDDLPAPTVSYLEKHRKAPIFVLGPSSAISSELIREAGKIGGPVSRVAGEDPVANAIALARHSRGGFGWDVNDPGHGFVLARDRSPFAAALAAPLSASGTWGPLLLTDGADTLPAELRDYFLDLKPGYTDNPTRAFYNHVWVIGDEEEIDVNQQAEVNELAELAKIGAAP